MRPGEFVHFPVWPATLLSSNWESYRDSFNISGTKNLWMIPFDDNISEEDILKTEQIIDFYGGSYENINDAKTSIR